MSNRVTEKDLNEIVLKVNKLTFSPITFMTDGVMNVGHYHISCAFGGYALHRLESTGGSTSAVWGGYCPKKELYKKIEVFISGIQANN